jgi:hypothetical protein
MTREDLDHAIVEARVQAVAIEFDLMEPAVTLGGFVHARGQLRRYERRRAFT